MSKQQTSGVTPQGHGTKANAAAPAPPAAAPTAAAADSRPRYPGSLVVEHVKATITERMRRRGSRPRSAALTRMEQLVIAYEGVVLLGVVVIGFLKSSTDAYMHERTTELDRRRELVEQYEVQCHSSMAHIKQLQGSLAFWGELHTRSEERVTRWNLQHQVDQLRQQLHERQIQQYRQDQTQHQHQQQRQPQAMEGAYSQGSQNGHDSASTTRKPGWWARFTGMFSGYGRHTHGSSTSSSSTNTGFDTSSTGANAAITASCTADTAPATSAVGAAAGSAGTVGDSGSALAGDTEHGAGTVGSVSDEPKEPTHSHSTSHCTSQQLDDHTGNPRPSSSAAGGDKEDGAGILRPAFDHKPAPTPSHGHSTSQPPDGGHAVSAGTEGEQGHDSRVIVTHGQGPHAPAASHNHSSHADRLPTIDLDGPPTHTGHADSTPEPSNHADSIPPPTPSTPAPWLVPNRGSVQGHVMGVAAAGQALLHSKDTAEHWQGWNDTCEQQKALLLSLYDLELRHLFESEAQYTRWLKYQARDLVFEWGGLFTLPSFLGRLLFKDPADQTLKTKHSSHGEPSMARPDDANSSSDDPERSPAQSSHHPSAQTEQNTFVSNDSPSSSSTRQEGSQGGGSGNQMQGNASHNHAGQETDKKRTRNPNQSQGTVLSHSSHGSTRNPEPNNTVTSNPGPDGGPEHVTASGADGRPARSVLISFRVWRPLWEAGDAEEQLADQQSTWDAVWNHVVGEE